MAVNTNSQLSDVKLKAEEIWAKGQFSDQYIAKAETAKVIAKEQTATVAPITGKQEKDNKVEVSWFNTCAMETSDCTVGEGGDPNDIWCDPSDPELTTLKKEYDLPLCQHAGFSIDENDIAKSYRSFEEAAAVGMLVAKKNLDEWFSRQGLIFIKANTGDNIAPAPYTFNGTTGVTEIPAANYTRKIVAYMEKVAELNQIENPYFLDGGELFIDLRDAELDGANGEGKGDDARRKALRLYFDMKGFAAAGITPDDTFMIGKHAIALGNRYYNPDTPTLFDFKDGNQTRWNEASNNIPGVRYDFIHTKVCKGPRVLHNFRAIMKGGYFLNPTSCNAAVTGLLGFAKV